MESRWRGTRPAETTLVLVKFLKIKCNFGTVSNMAFICFASELTAHPTCVGRFANKLTQPLLVPTYPPQSQHAVHEYRSSPPPPSLIALTCVRTISHIFQLHTPKTDSGYICEVRINQDPRIREIKTKIKSTIPTKLKSNCKSLPFFYFLTFEKADCSILALLVGWSVSWRHH